MSVTLIFVTCDNQIKPAFMKKALSSISLISLIVVLAGVVFKIKHWHPASILLVLGTVVFIILGIIWLFTKKKNPFMTYLGITIIVLITSFLWQAQHWPGGDIFFWVSLIMTFVLATALFSKKE